MIDKSHTFQTINEVLKQTILPHIENSMAKEQAIALISVLKNLDMQTVQNVSAQEQIIILAEQTLQEYLTYIQNDDIHFQNSSSWIKEMKQKIEKAVAIKDITKKWEQLYELQCQFIRFLYKEAAINHSIVDQYISPLRKKLREQLTIEMSLVR